ncbi:MAG: glutamate synthase subunit beta [Verrucomicrobiae bacterium]|nr:glutamate synthase subunit beta [Verrucomicrobiae bacterium]
MGSPTGFKEIPRELAPDRPVSERLRDWREISGLLPDDRLRAQGARCMDCGIPFCHSACPVGNLIPQWNDLVNRGRWRDALTMLLKTNNFPEFTGRVCPAPCEEACVLNLERRPVTIKQIERAIIEHAFAQGWIVPQPPLLRTGKKVAVVGSGPAGLAAAAQLNKAGHLVTVFERADRVGGLLTYGIPSFKLEKSVVARRVNLMEQEGIVFRVNAHVGKDLPAGGLLGEFDALCLAGGAALPRDLPVPGRDLRGIHFAMEFLPRQNRLNFGEAESEGFLSAQGKHVVVIGGGDTGSDCVGTAHRQGAKSVTQFELLPRPPEERTPDMPWPRWPMILRVSTSHEEGGRRDWSVSTKAFSGEKGLVKSLHATRLEWTKGIDGRPGMKEVPGSEFEAPCDLCLLAMGFLGPEKGGMLDQLGVKLNAQGNVATDANFMTSLPGVFAAGDMRRGQSLVVWAIQEGRQAARAVDAFLMGRSDL